MLFPILLVYSVADFRQDRKVSLFRHDNDGDVDISISQDLQTIRRKLASALSIIDGINNVITIISEESEALQIIAEIEPSLQQAFQRELRYISNDLKSHASTAKKLMVFAEDIRHLVGSLPHFLLSLLYLIFLTFVPES